jgi:uncharacterized membrane protein YhiD involved in acid resistance
LAAGAGAYGAAVATTIVTLIVLAVLAPVEDYFESAARRRGARHGPTARDD